MDIKIIATNKKAHFEYEILDKIEAGIELKGTEVKSLRFGKCSLGEGYIVDENLEIFVKNINIPQYSHGNIFNHDPKRKRKLLLHKKEIQKLTRTIKEKGLTAIPLRMYFKGSVIKVEIALCRGKKLYDKRETIKQRDSNRTIERETKREK
jgi:SsrA-binding protein